MAKCIAVGAGAAGCFAAIHAAEAGYEVSLLEKTQQPLAKVRISGGGRCNVTHACFDPKELVQNYPRGQRELLGPFHHFGPQDTIEWFEARGVKLKTEKDGRMFPTTDRSQTIIDCLMGEIDRLGVDLQLGAKVEKLEADKIILATGGNRAGYKLAKGHTIIPPVPSLFTFNVPSSPLLHLSGVVAPEATVRLEGGSRTETGPVLLTHWGFSGPAILKLSAFEARFLHDKKYNATLIIEWGENLPKRLRHVEETRFHIEGKSTNKAEFVTCGGISLKEVNFKTMESRLVPGLHFAGEILNIDGVTGGFNFQNAWTTGYLAGRL